MQEAVATHREIDERGLKARFDVHHPAFIDVARIVLVTGPFDVKLFENAVFHHGDSALLRLEDVDEHFLLFHRHHAAISLGWFVGFRSNAAPRLGKMRTMSGIREKEPKHGNRNVLEWGETACDQSPNESCREQLAQPRTP
jgi:hypothetical protein